MGIHRDILTTRYRNSSNSVKNTIANGLISRLSEKEAEEFLEEYDLYKEED